MPKTPTGLTPKQQQFIAEYLTDLNATRAASAVGYHPKTAAWLMAKHSIRTAIEAGQRQQLATLDITGAMVKARLALLGFQDIRKIFDDAGNLRPVHTLSDDAAAMIAGVEVIIKNAAAGDGITDRIHKVRVVDPVRPLEMLAKHFGLLDEHVVHSGELRFSWAPSPK